MKRRRAGLTATSVAPSQPKLSEPPGTADPVTTSSSSNLDLRVPREFFAKPSVDLAKALLGKVLVKKLDSGEILKGIIVETEAYRMDDAASHSYGGRRGKKNEATFMGPGHANVYFTYGMYHCINLTAGEDGSACLLRGLEPLEGLDTMRSFRDRARKKAKVNPSVAALKTKPAKVLENWEICNGPGKLCLAFDLTVAGTDRIDLCSSDSFWLEENEDQSFADQKFEIVTATRIGIDKCPPKARNQPWRFYIKDNHSVSTMKPGAIKKLLKAAASVVMATCGTTPGEALVQDPENDGGAVSKYFKKE